MGFDNISILGAGPIGRTIFAYLNHNNTKCHLLVKEKYKSEINNRLLTVKAPLNDFAVKMVCDNKGLIDCLIVCVKAGQLLASIIEIKPKLSSDCLILLTQNGFGYHDKVEDILTGYNISYMSCMFGAKIRQDILYLSNEPNVVVSSEVKIISLLKKAQFTVKVSSNIFLDLQYKLVINASLNALGAIYQVPHGELFADVNIRARVKNVCLESTRILNYIGFNVAPNDMWNNLKQMLPSIATNYSSMASDVAQGKSTEIAYINGYLVDLARQHELLCSYNLQVIDDLESCYV